SAGGAGGGEFGIVSDGQGAAAAAADRDGGGDRELGGDAADDRAFDATRDAAFADPRAGGILGGQDGIHPDQRRHGGAGGERERQAVSAARAFGIPGDAGGSRGPVYAAAQPQGDRQGQEISAGGGGDRRGVPGGGRADRTHAGEEGD